MGPANPMLFLNGFHFISGHATQHIQANHHCVVMSADFIQCAIYVPGSNPARLAGIEYIVSADVFKTFPLEERQLWHSHGYEVTSGFLTEPGMPGGMDDEAMKILINTYGKTVHTWRFDQKDNAYPLGIPELVSGFTADGQVKPEIIKSRDAMFGISTDGTKKRRKNMKKPDIIDGADSWRYGYALELQLSNKTFSTGFAKNE